MAHFIFNVEEDDAPQAGQLLRARIWAVGDHEPHRDALAAGDLALIYLAAPARTFIGRVRLGSSVRDWTQADDPSGPTRPPSGVSLAEVDDWDPPVPMRTVLSTIDQSAGARADFDTGVIQITEEEYRQAVSVAARRGAEPGC